MSIKIKLSAIFALSAVTLFGFFIIPAQTFAATCNSVTLAGNVIVNDSPARVRFTYSADYNIVANGQGIPTAVQTFYSNGYVEQFIFGLSQNTVYYYRLEMTSAYGTVMTNISSFKTQGCVAKNIPTIVTPYPTVVLYADKASVPLNGAVTIRWLSTNATSCNASGGNFGWEGAKSVGSGAFYAGSLTSNTTYSITCSNNFGSATDSVSVAILSAITKKQASKIATQTWSDSAWSEPINKIIAPSAKTFLGANVLETGFLPTNIFVWLFLIIFILILIFLVRHTPDQSFRKKP